MSIEPGRLQELRCADQDRELVAQLLNNAYADGRLTFEEHADRIAKAYDAKTFGQLTPLTTDLVAPQPQPVVAPYSAPSPTPLGGTPGARLVANFPTAGQIAGIDVFTGCDAVLSTVKRSRLHTIASTLTVNAWLGEIKLDLVGAAFESRETVINIGGVMGEINIRVPDGVSVDTSHLKVIVGESKIDGIVHHPQGVRLRLVGTFVLGEVNVLGPDTARARKYQRFNN